MDDIRGAFERHTDCLFPESADYWRCRGWKREFDSSSVLRTGLCSASRPTAIWKQIALLLTLQKEMPEKKTLLLDVMWTPNVHHLLT
ncbi:hypothetical protein Y1Q_0001353 [Alligator mississippiensis]|uniref:Uncharacterized protein n=1 Tax=Alligator mississippiensis TaxID=8496 RepID=A0A151M987_ALLMI|nr:hypothetical protein Y1Q_0001353 [Alligator mississippiensis]